MPDASEERPVFSMSEFGPRKGLLIKKALLEKTEHQILQCILRASEIQVSFIVKGRGDKARHGCEPKTGRC